MGDSFPFNSEYLDGFQKLYIYIILKAQQDYLDFKSPKDYVEYKIFEEAQKFLFDDAWETSVNDETITLEEICQYIGYSSRAMRDTFIKEKLDKMVYEIPELYEINKE